MNARDSHGATDLPGLERLLPVPGRVSVDSSALGASARLLVVIVAADAAAWAFAAPLPGSILAMALYFGLFALQGGPDLGTVRLYRVVARYLPMLFVPLGVGVMTLGRLQLDVWLAVVIVVVAGTLATTLAIGITAQLLLTNRSAEEP